MSGMNPVVLIQLLMQYGTQPEKAAPRRFAFTRNNRMVVHKETTEECLKRKSYLNEDTSAKVYEALCEKLQKTLLNRVGKVYIDDDMFKIAVPIQMQTGSSGFGILPTGSRIDIPEGKFIRAFTYWEKVNDIDLSCFAINDDGNREEFSWRNMYSKQGMDVAYSGDQTSGYNGGSEYFDINIEEFKKNHPGFRYVVFCNNVYSGINFAKCDCTAGFMIREEAPDDIPVWKGERNPNVKYANEIFDPKTVATSFRINAESTFAYLFAIDLEAREMVWLNMANSLNSRVAGSTDMEFLLKYMNITDIFNVGLLYDWAGTSVDKPEEADIIVDDHDRVCQNAGDNQEVVHSYDIEKMLRLLNPAS